MTTAEAIEIRRQYSEYDDKFRTAKKQGDYRKASEMKAKRDALSAKCDEAIKFMLNNK